MAFVSRWSSKRLSVPADRPKQKSVVLQGNVVSSFLPEDFDIEVVVTCRQGGLIKRNLKTPRLLRPLLDIKSTKSQLKAIRRIETWKRKQPENSMDLQEILLGVRFAKGAVSLVYDPEITTAQDQVFRRLRSKLNSQQRRAVNTILKAPGGIVNIRGLPGCGMTATGLVALLYAVACGIKVLACAPSNKAVESLLQKTLEIGEQQGMKLMRWTPQYITDRQFEAAMAVDGSTAADEAERLLMTLLHEYEEALNEDWDRTAFAACSPAAWMKATIHKHKDSAEPFGKTCKLFMELHECLKAPRKGNKTRAQVKRDQNNYKACYDENRDHAIGQMDVVYVALNSSSADHLVNQFKPEILFIDEATQALEADAIVPLSAYRTLRTLRTLVQLGDEAQLAPVAMSRGVNEFYKDMEISLFERISFLAGQVWIDVNYRMPPSICEFVSQTFYRGQLKVAQGLEVETSLQRTFKAVWRGAIGLNEMPSHRVALSIPKDAYSESFAGTTTVYNWREACYVSWIVDSLLKHEPTRVRSRFNRPISRSSPLTLDRNGGSDGLSLMK